MADEQGAGDVDVDKLAVQCYNNVIIMTVSPKSITNWHA